MTTTAEYLAHVARVGPFFTVHTGTAMPSPGFLRLADLHTPGRALDTYTAFVGARLGTRDARVAASTAHLGVAARLWSLALASAALHGRVPDLGALWLRPDPAGTRWWLPDPRDADGPDPASAAYTTVMADHLTPLGDAVRRGTGVSPHTLRGNAASALAGALRVLLHAAPTARSALPLTRALLAREPLRDAGRLHVDATGDPAYARRNCCLYYRVPGAATCGDCVLRQ
ncbi:(2Fe-2S)-binding protein [Streptomyces chumphonensis]|uniref:(2Fe-2S)-binding protein n=1 Tax=Streptomyces chumphonensis TaxID=1214925 RepID=A0A927IE08_9ACTN|nr:(2Fe-2S)-binding protein [Streptomyces chumphonensis]MBD3933465.1 (2Fe-2S)-binding protein [Streptomyces chumphonensis]